MSNLEKFAVVELCKEDLTNIEGGGFGPFGFGFRVIMKPSFIIWQAQQMV